MEALTYILLGLAVLSFFAGIFTESPELLMVTLVLFIVSIFVYPEDTADKPKETVVQETVTYDHSDWENLGGGLYRICDGSNLIYGFGGRSITVSPNDPVCAVK